jgi:hypothetical protein
MGDMPIEAVNVDDLRDALNAVATASPKNAETRAAVEISLCIGIGTGALDGLRKSMASATRTLDEWTVRAGEFHHH